MPGTSGSSGVLDTLTVLFTDLVGSTALRAEVGEDIADVVRRAHDSVVAEVVAGHEGRIVKGLGDGFLATFGSAARARLGCQRLDRDDRRDPGRADGAR